MRFTRFEFQEYAGFRSRKLEFDRSKRLHLVLGKNEAGKSRLLRGLSHFLFGIPPKNDPDQFNVIATKSKLLANVFVRDQELSLERRRARDKAFINSVTGEVSNELEGLLGGLNEQQFLNLHALTNVQLQQGGQALMRRENDLGTSLFAAGAGMTRIEDLIKQAKARSDEVFRPSGNAKKRLNLLLEELDGMKARLKSIELNQPQYNALVADLGKAESRKLELEQQREKLQIALAQMGQQSSLKAELHQKQSLIAEMKIELENALKLESEALQKSALTKAALDAFKPASQTVLQTLTAELREQIQKVRLAEQGLAALPPDEAPLSKALDPAKLLAELPPDLKSVGDEVVRQTAKLNNGEMEFARLSHELGFDDADIHQVPLSRDMEALGEKIKRLSSDKEHVSARLEEAADHVIALQQRETKLTVEAPEIDPEKLAFLREERDLALGQAINALGAGSLPTAAENITKAQAVIRQLDTLSDQRLAKSNQVAQLLELRNQMTSSVADRESLSIKLEALEDSLEQANDQWRAAWQNAGLQTVAPDIYAKWQSAYQQLLEREKQVSGLRLEVIAAKERAAKLSEVVNASFQTWQQAFDPSSAETTEEQRDQLHAWANQLNAVQARQKGRRTLTENLLVEQGKLATLMEEVTRELMANGLATQSTAASTVAYVTQLFACLDLLKDCQKISSNLAAAQASADNLSKQLKNMPSSDLFAGRDVAELQHEVNALQHPLQDIRLEIKELSKKHEESLYSTDPLHLRSAIKVKEDEILQHARSWKMDKAAAHVLGEGLEAFVRKEGEGLIQRAATNLQALTTGKYSNIHIEGVGADSLWSLSGQDGEEVPASGLSDGTRDQLFLAVRLAFLDNTHLPFIADDLFVNFDDTRSAEAFGLLDKALPTSQLFYLTHHPHMVDIAEAALGKERVEVLELK